MPTGSSNFAASLSTETADSTDAPLPLSVPRRSPPEHKNVAEKVVEVAECGTFVGHAAIVIQECLDTITDPSATKGAISAAHKRMGEVSQKMQATAPVIVSTVATANKKVKGGKKALQKVQQEEKWKRSQFQSVATKKKSDALLAVEQFDPTKKTDTYAAASDAVQSPPAGPPARRTSPRASPIPAPSHGVEYDRVQTWQILRECKNEKEVMAAKNAMYPEGKAPFVPVSRRQLNRFWNKYKERSTPPHP